MTRQTADLKQQIERILRWEPSRHWRPRDFAQLSERIERHTQQYVAAQELQLFWQSSAEPSSGLLDALARFADYDDWTDFCDRNFYGDVTLDEETQLLHAPMWEIPIRWVIAICWLSVIGSIVVAALLIWKR
ncbi:hypothetical protein IC229_23615 [Spirosoma sp. BT702]|uniref:Uncharacterized protein n=1 Tax=Spirosoma profusum TaxID=2771354 RepID=A0A926Y3R9_9BACT|nr:hypothetical protein [Spirosoma profusum]MBD2703653.1 hypothetical protein [Spirosoma profusum]